LGGVRRKEFRTGDGGLKGGTVPDVGGRGKHASITSWTLRKSEGGGGRRGDLCRRRVSGVSMNWFLDGYREEDYGGRGGYGRNQKG